MPNIELKRNAAEKAIEKVRSGMVLGLGSGSTVQFALEIISEKLISGELKDIVGVPSSKRTEQEAIRLGIPLVLLGIRDKAQGTRDKAQRIRHNGQVENEELNVIDITIDGADECDRNLNLIKGGGGAMLREKIVAEASKQNVTIIDESKLSDKLGSKSSLPVEILEFSLESEKQFLESLGAQVSIRKNSNDENFITDNGNMILDAKFSTIENIEELNDKLNARAGILGHGLFVGLSDEVICAGKNGVEILRKK